MRCGESSVPGGSGQSVGSFARRSSRRASVSRPHASETGAFRISGSALALLCGPARRHALIGEEDTAMTEDLLVTAGVLIASAICGWYVVHAISGVILSMPVDDTCTMAAQCLALAGG